MMKSHGVAGEDRLVGDVLGDHRLAEALRRDEHDVARVLEEVERERGLDGVAVDALGPAQSKSAIGLKRPSAQRRGGARGCACAVALSRRRRCARGAARCPTASWWRARRGRRDPSRWRRSRGREGGVSRGRSCRALVLSAGLAVRGRRESVVGAEGVGHDARSRTRGSAGAARRWPAAESCARRAWSSRCDRRTRRRARRDEGLGEARCRGSAAP